MPNPDLRPQRRLGPLLPRLDATNAALLTALPMKRHLDHGVRVALGSAAGAQAPDLEDQVGDLRPGKSADLIVIRPPEVRVADAIAASRAVGQPQ